MHLLKEEVLAAGGLLLMMHCSAHSVGLRILGCGHLDIFLHFIDAQAGTLPDPRSLLGSALAGQGAAFDDPLLLRLGAHVEAAATFALHGCAQFSMGLCLQPRVRHLTRTDHILFRHSILRFR